MGPTLSSPFTGPASALARLIFDRRRRELACRLPGSA